MKGKQESSNHRSDWGCLDRNHCGPTGVENVLIELFHYTEVYVPLTESKIFVIRKAILPFF
jgi:hypothetical protein